MVYFILGIIVLILDIATKFVAMQNLQGVNTVSIWQNVFHFTYVENRGIAFGMFENARFFFIVATIIILVILSCLYIKTEYRTKWLKVGTALIYGGAIGNFIDRIARGFVVDFLDFRIINFPVFNVADIAVCVGAAMLVMHFFISEKRAEQVEEKEDEENA